MPDSGSLDPALCAILGSKGREDRKGRGREVGSKNQGRSSLLLAVVKEWSGNSRFQRRRAQTGYPRPTTRHKHELLLSNQAQSIQTGHVSTLYLPRQTSGTKKLVEAKRRRVKAVPLPK
jgi:hypothetical protein